MAFAVGTSVVVAVLLLATTQVLAARAESAHPAAGRFVEVDGRRLHYVDEGDGPPIVLLHGAYGGLDDWRATILPELARDHRVVALDRPGHGHSERGDGDVASPVAQGRVVRSFLQRIGVEQPVLVGFSWSGPLVLSMTLEHPDEVRACVTVNGATHPWPDPLETEYTLPAVPVVGDVFVELLVAPVGALMSGTASEKAFAPAPVAPEFESSPVALSLRPRSYRAVAEDIRALRPCTRALSKRYGDLSMPVVVVVGDGDQVAWPGIHSYPLAETAPRGELIRVPDGGHQLPYSHPDVVIDAVRRAVAASE
jgi:pimeloyl-ACP methyl ester carboxylesterase